MESEDNRQPLRLPNNPFFVGGGTPADIPYDQYEQIMQQRTLTVPYPTVTAQSGYSSGIKTAQDIYDDLHRAYVSLQNDLKRKTAELVEAREKAQTIPDGFQFRWTMHGVILDCQRTDHVPGGGYCDYEGVPLEELGLAEAVALCEQHVETKHSG
jgi:hypothetical protein